MGNQKYLISFVAKILIFSWNADYRYENINRGDSKGVSTADENAAPAPRNTLFDELKR